MNVKPKMRKLIEQLPNIQIINGFQGLAFCALQVIWGDHEKTAALDVPSLLLNTPRPVSLASQPLKYEVIRAFLVEEFPQMS